MHIENYKEPHSAFLSIEKDMGQITNLMLKNERLKKLLYYTTPDCLKKPNLTEDESLSLIKNNIKMVPKIIVSDKVLNYILISFDNFIESANPEFRDNIIQFDIICHFSQWELNDFQLRPYKIAAELDSMLNDMHLSGIGQVQFLGANQIVINDELAGLCLTYYVVHGGEDKVNAPLAKDDKDQKENFDNVFNK